MSPLRMVSLSPSRLATACKVETDGEKELHILIIQGEMDLYLYNLPAEPFLLELFAQCELDRVVHPRRQPGHAPLRPTLRYLYAENIFVNV